jgi:ribokinase
MSQQSPAGARICVVGSANMDLIARVPRLPRLGETLIGHSFRASYGGKGANQAVMAARLGARVSMVARLGRDVFGEDMLRNYQSQGIDTRFVSFDAQASTGVAPILVDDRADNCIVVVPGANAALSPGDARAARSAIEGAHVLVCQLETPVETTLEAFGIAKAAGVTTILNPAPAAPLPGALLELTDLLAPNETEAELLTGLPAGSPAEAEQAARALSARGPRTVIVTLGERGLVCLHRGVAEHVPARRVEAVDPTGAGDAFIGALAVFLAEGLDLPAGVRRAGVAASLSVTRPGAQASFPDRAEVEAACAADGL